LLVSFDKLFFQIHDFGMALLISKISVVSKFKILFSRKSYHQFIFRKKKFKHSIENSTKNLPLPRLKTNEMFKYDNRGKNENAKNIIEYLKQSRGILISPQSADRLVYLLNLRHIMVDSVAVSGQELNTGKMVETTINIKEINQNIRNATMANGVK